MMLYKVYKVVVTLLARIHTGFHRFTKIGQTFHNTYIFNKKETLFKLRSGQYPVRMTLKPRKGQYKELKSKTSVDEIQCGVAFQMNMKPAHQSFFSRWLLFIWYGVITFKSVDVILYFAVQMKASEQYFLLFSYCNSKHCD